MPAVRRSPASGLEHRRRPPLVVVDNEAARWRLVTGGLEHVSRCNGRRNAGGEGQDGVTALNGAGRPEPGVDGI